MRPVARVAFVVFAVMISASIVGVVTLVRRGFSAREEPSRLEAAIARRLRHLAVPAAARDAVNPITVDAHVLREARSHFADHCASCHGNDGRGETALGRGLYPKAPDMQASATQRLSDGELFYIIHNGIRFTGMPGWGDGAPDDDQESWKLVHFIRHLPTITQGELVEMESLNPKTHSQLIEEERIRQFLEGNPTEPSEPAHEP